MSALSIIIFGASGDLTARKLIPSLFRLFVKGRLPAETRIVGVARSPLGDDEFRSRLAKAVHEFAPKDWDASHWPEFAARVGYAPGDATQPGGLDPLQERLREIEGIGAGRRLYYLAVAPQLYPGIATRLGEAGMAQEATGWRRLVIEKPFGHDLESARQLNQTLHAHFREKQIYRIDHYLGKETVQNILVFRFANTLFEPVWNHNFIDHVQINVSESVTVGQRGDYYDRAGVLRDMFQNHLLQLLTLVAMEAPARFAADPLRNEKIKVLEAMPVMEAEEAASSVACGQYQGYRGERGVAANSRTPTYGVARFQVNNWRWQGVPFYLRSGKALKTRTSEVIIQFHCPPHLMFPMPAGETLQCNRLSLCIQPDEGIHLNFQTKVPDQSIALRPADLEFHYCRAYPEVIIPDAYERLIQDALNGDAALFMRSDEIERAWEIMDPLLAAVEAPGAPEPELYPVGSEGPANAQAFLARDGRPLLTTCVHEAGGKKPCD
jgi:glucose-6-phosphate 1-dehydrogenase